MNNVRSIFGMKQTNGCVGIEIETEAARPYDVPAIKGWHHKGDGSLRDFGVEFITRGAIAKKDVKDSLSTWKDTLGDIHARLNPASISTSVHVHVNIQELTPLELLNYYLTSIAFENLLSKFAGPDREGNLFCLRTSDAETNFNSIRHNIAMVTNTQQLAHAFNVGDNRYGNINTVPIRTFGSLEFRIMRGTTDIQEMQIWTETLLAIREYTKQFKDPKEILALIKQKGVQHFTKEALGSHGKIFMTNNYEKLVLPNLGYLAQIATSRKDWDIKDVVREEPKLKMMKLLPVARQGRDDFNRVIVQWDEQFEVEDI